MDLFEQNKKLVNLKHQYLKKIELINFQIEENNKIIVERCNNKGHEWITEREPGMYGENFTFCNNCKVDYYDSSFFH